MNRLAMCTIHLVTSLFSLPLLLCIYTRYSAGLTERPIIGWRRFRMSGSYNMEFSGVRMLYTAVLTYGVTICIANRALIGYEIDV